MSQYGANAMAKNGKDFEDILTHYYQGTYLKQANTDGIDIKVKLSASPGGGAIIVASGSVKNESTGEILSAGAIVSAVPGLVLSPQDATSRLTVTYKYNSFNIYRGQINVIGSPGRLVTYNILPLEDYLRGVVPGEMPASWQKEALKAQAVAARNYAYKNREICDTPSCQVYHGALKEVASTNQAIEETRGQLLFYGSEIITAYYFSTSGGWTENNENVWGGTPRSWLRGVESPGEEDSPHYRWQAKTLDKATLENYLNSDPDTAVGNVEKIEITKRGVSGLVMAVKITGSSGTKLVTGQNFKYVINVNLPDGTQDYVKSGLFGIR
ncbi:SpoIID/LytB domain-containing protein [Candidatus Microgenomates bacterium]|nr:SpoIID/LytB domain-containing protein [Candidatus Microgenomates bacterium]